MRARRAEAGNNHPRTGDIPYAGRNLWGVGDGLISQLSTEGLMPIKEERTVAADFGERYGR